MDRQDRKKIIDAYKQRRAVGGVFAVKNTKTGRALIQFATDLQGSRNRFEFSQATGGCAFKPLEEDYKTFGNGVFSFEVIEQLEQKEGQTDKDFRDEIEALYNMLLEGMDKDKVY